jgi:hypothetical protein
MMKAPPVSTAAPVAAGPQRAVGAALSLLAWLGVALQLRLSLELARGNGKSIAAGLGIFLGYFTILTNIFVALTATAVAVSAGHPRSWLARRSVIGCATTAILLVGIAYHLLLRDLWSPRGLQWLADVDLHYVVPAAALLHWVASRGARPATTAPLLWCAYPAAYLVYALIRGAWLHDYPYPFIDAAAIGYARVALNSTGLLATYLALGYGVRALSRS